MTDRGRRSRPAKSSRLTVRGAAMLGASTALFGAAYLLGWPELLMVGCLAGVPPLLAWLLVGVRRAKLSVERSLPSTIGLGDTATVRLSLGDLEASRAGSAEWSDLLPWPPGKTHPAALASVPVRGAGRRSPLRYEIRPTCRGVVDVGPLVISFGDPFGLARRTVPVPGTQRLVVAPQVLSLPVEAVRAAIGPDHAHQFGRRAPAGDDDVMTRAYRSGDALRRVHWRTSARQGELMVRENEQSRPAEVVLVLETRALGYRDLASGEQSDRPESESFEWALRMTASLAARLDSLGVSLRVVETARPQLRAAGFGEVFLEELARMKLSRSDEDWLEHNSGGIDPTAGRSLLVAVLGEPSPRTAQRLARLSPSGDRALAFLFSSPESEAFDVLRRTGWACLNVSVQDPVDEAWTAVIEAGAHAAA